MRTIETTIEPGTTASTLATAKLAAGELILARSLPIDQNPVNIYISSLAPGSRRTMAMSLRLIAGLLVEGRCNVISLHWAGLRYQHTHAVRDALAERYAPATANKMLAAIRGVLKVAWQLGQIPTHDYYLAIRWEPIRAKTLSRRRALSLGELRALFDTCARDITQDGKIRAVAIRDAAVIATLYGAGLRRSELVALDVRDCDAKTGRFHIRTGKGQKPRVVYAGCGVREALTAWLELRGEEPGPLFLPLLKSGRIAYRRLTDQTIFTLLSRRGQQAGVTDFSPNVLRRSFISNLLDAGVEIGTVQNLAGHVAVATTTRYDRQDKVASQNGAELLDVPFHNYSRLSAGVNQTCAGAGAMKCFEAGRTLALN